MPHQQFDIHPDHSPVTSVEIGTAPGPVLEILNLGATLHRLEISGADGERREVTLGAATVAERVAATDFFGVTIGRYANRIAGGRFSLAGQEVQVDTSEGGNSLHGGPVGFDRVMWEVVQATAEEVTLRYVSADGDQGFPGRLVAEVTYRVSEGDASETARVEIVHRATCDAPTVVNMTHHSYFNLDGDGAGSVDQHLLTVDAADYLPVRADGIPTGEVASVTGTPFDFRAPVPVGDAVRSNHEQVRQAAGLDHCLVVTGEGLRRHAVLESARSRTRMELWSDQPGVQVYTANGFDGSQRSRRGRAYRQGDGIALEPQKFPDSPNHPEWPSALLMPGEEYRHLLQWRFSPR